MFELKTDFAITLETDQILMGQGVDPSRASPSILKSAEEVREELDKLIEPSALFGSLPVRDFRHECITFDGGFFEGPLVARSMAGAIELALGLCTIGPRLEQRVNELMKREPVKAMALEGAGVAAVGLVSFLTAGIITEAAEERGITAGMQIRPGQEGWPLEQQGTLFQVLPAHRINIRLTNSFLMLPRKSISFAIPLGNAMCTDAVPCDFCSKREHCKWRQQ